MLAVDSRVNVPGTSGATGVTSASVERPPGSGKTEALGDVSTGSPASDRVMDVLMMTGLVPE